MSDARGLARAVALGLALALCLAAAAPAADLRRKEVVGVEPLRQDGERTTPPRDGALRAAVARAVEDVALETLPRDWQTAAPMPVAGSEMASGLAPALGQDPFEYASRFRILEDRGVRQALLSGAGAKEEYVVLVEVFVDARRVRDRLAAAGWIDGPAGQRASRVRLVVEGMTSYAAYETLRQALVDDLGMRSALPVEMSRGRAVLELEGRYDTASLQSALERSDRPGLRVVPLDRDEESLTVLVDWTPPAPPPASEADADAGAPEGR